MVGGAAYYGGKRHQQGQDRESDQEARLQELEAQQQSAPPPQQYEPPPQQYAPPPAAAAAPAGMSDSTIEQLTKLGQLHESGVLTDDEFEQQKRRLLG